MTATPAPRPPHPLRSGAARMLGACAVFASAAATPPVGADGAYRWTDDAGRVHFSDRRPGTGNAETIELRQAPRTGAPAPAQTAREKRLLRVFEIERAEERAAAAEAEKEAEQRANRCADARRRLKKYATARYLYEATDDGGQRVLSHAERQAAEEEAAASVQALCGTVE